MPSASTVRRRRDPAKHRQYSRNSRARKPKWQCHDCVQPVVTGIKGSTLLCKSCGDKRATGQRKRVHDFDTVDETRYRDVSACDWCGLPFNFGKESPYVDHDHACCSGIKHCFRCTRGFVHHKCNLWAIPYAEWLEKQFDIRDPKLEEYRLKFSVPRSR